MVNTADFSLVSIQPYELAYHAHPFHRRMNNLYHILLLYTYRRTPYHNGSNGRIHDPEYVAIHAQPVALSPATPWQATALPNHSIPPREPFRRTTSSASSNSAIRTPRPSILVDSSTPKALPTNKPASSPFSLTPYPISFGSPDTSYPPAVLCNRTSYSKSNYTSRINYLRKP